jgi:hypothetical protein
LLIDDIHIGFDVVIVDFIGTNWVSWATFFRGMVVIVTICKKRRFYHDHYSAHMFLLLAIEVLNCPHQ